MDYFASMRAFIRVVELGSFSAAANEDGTKVSTISRYIAALEEDLGASLFNRSTRRLHLTEIGTHFYDRACRVMADVEAAKEEAVALNASPRGLLRVAAPSSFARLHLVPHLTAFLDEYPEIRIDLVSGGKPAELISSGVDVAIAMGALSDSTLLTRGLAPYRCELVASPEYIERVDPVQTPEDLGNCRVLLTKFVEHQSIILNDTSESSGQKTHEIALQGRVRCDDPDILLAMTLNHEGIALLPSWLVAQEKAAGRLVAVLPQWQMATSATADQTIWAVYAPKKIVPPKVKVFTAFLAAQYRRQPLM